MKDVDDAICMDVLGHTVFLDCASLSVEIQVQDLKADAWTSSLSAIISESFVGADLSLKMAGRLGSTVSVNPDRTGRAYVKPFFAQAYAPLRFASAHLLRACYWWIECLNERPLSVQYADGLPRPSTVIWSDAAGVSRKIAFVACVWSSSGPRWYWSCLTLPQDIWDLLIARHDEPIQFQEFVDIPMAYSSLALRGHLVHQWIDNNSVLWSMLKGSSRLPEVNAGVARSWTDFREQQIAWLPRDERREYRRWSYA